MAPNPNFETTQWSLVLSAGNGPSPAAQLALEKLCEKYWLPLYLHLRRLGRDPDQASDLTQGFFTKLIEKNYVADADRSRGRFRTFLLSSLTNYVSNEWDRTQAAKRGGGRTRLPLDFHMGEERFLQEPQSGETPEKLFERQWAVTLLENVLRELEDEYDSKGKSDQFSKLRPFLTPHPNESYREVGEALDMSTGAVKVAVHRLRSRYREKLLEEIASTVADWSDAESEAHKLFDTFSRD